MGELDHKVKELSTACPRLRRDVRTHYKEHHGKPSYVVEDTARGRYFHIGFPEHQFIQCLDGRTTVSRALARNAASQGENALTEQQAGQLVRWLVDNDLLETDSSGQGERRKNQFTRSELKKPIRLFSKLLFLRIPLGCPDRFFQRITPFTGWIFSSAGLILWASLVAYTLIKLGPEWERFAKASGQVIAPNNWLRMILIYGVLKVFHEFGHGIATRKFGGEVPEWGVQLLVFVTPMAFVDASASWRLPSRAKRIIVSAAGMYVEVALACLCILGWLYTGPGTLNTSFHSAVVAATLITVLFNANPLMRFDGYYMLVDWLGIPNLGSKGQQFMKWFGKRVILGAKDLPFPEQVKQHPVAIPLYGVLAALWKVVIWTGIMITLSLLFKGAGFAIAAGMTIMMILGGVFAVLKILFEKGKSPTIYTALPRLILIVLVLGSVGYLVRINPTGKAVAVVEYSAKETVRVGCEGFVTGVFVQDGDLVEEGDLIMKLENRDVQTSHSQMEIELRQAKIRARRYYQNDDLSAFQAEQETIAGLEDKVRENFEYLSNLEIKAPVSGKIVGRYLDSLPGQWLRLGAEILSIAPNRERELLISFRQRDINAINQRSDDYVTFRLSGRGEDFDGVLARLESRATRAVPHQVLISTNGGPLPIKNTIDPDSRGDQEIARGGTGDRDHFTALDEENSQVELAHPRFAASADISGAAEADLMEGEWGYVRLSNARKERLAIWLYEEVSGYVRKKIEQAKMAG